MKNEKTSSVIARIASRIFRGGRYTKAEARKVAASALTQTTDKEKTTKK